MPYCQGRLLFSTDEHTGMAALYEQMRDAVAPLGKKAVPPFSRINRHSIPSDPLTHAFLTSMGLDLEAIHSLVSETDDGLIIGFKPLSEGSDTICLPREHSALGRTRPRFFSDSWDIIACGHGSIDIVLDSNVLWHARKSDEGTAGRLTIPQPPRTIQLLVNEQISNERAATLDQIFQHEVLANVRAPIKGLTFQAQTDFADIHIVMDEITIQ